MLDIQFIRDNQEKVKKGVKAKQLDPKLVDDVLTIDEKRRKLLQEIEKLRANRNRFAKEKNVEKGKKIKKELQEKEPELKEVEQKYQEALWRVPNLPADDVPVGKNESENKVLRKWGKREKFDFKPKDHLELGESLDVIDVKRAAKVSGTRFGYLKGDAVMLQFALVQFTLETLTDQKIVKKIAKSVGNPSDTLFIPIIPPVIAIPPVSWSAVTTINVSPSFAANSNAFPIALSKSSISSTI